MAQMAAGHTTATMTLKHYIKGRENCLRMANAIDQTYSHVIDKIVDRVES